VNETTTNISLFWVGSACQVSSFSHFLFIEGEFFFSCGWWLALRSPSEAEVFLNSRVEEAARDWVKIKKSGLTSKTVNNNIPGHPSRLQSASVVREFFVDFVCTSRVSGTEYLRAGVVCLSKFCEVL
jgi:hypothetical protein